MSVVACAGLLALLSGLFIVLSWVGWRYFVAPDAPIRAASPAVVATASEPQVPEALLPRPKRLRSILAWAIVSMLCAAALVASVFLLSERVSLDPLAAFEMDRQAHIQAALNPERLVPPPSLPPSMFVSSERPALETADRDWAKLDFVFSQSVLRVLARLSERGYDFALLEGYRSPDRQDKLADLGAHVTNARAYQSRHQFGLAVDLAPVRDGRLQISERETSAMKAYQALGEEAEKAGLAWGGRWALKDYGHIEAAGKQAGAVGTAAADNRR